VVWACRDKTCRVDQIEDSQIPRGRGRPRETIRKELEIMRWTKILFMIEHYGVI